WTLVRAGVQMFLATHDYLMARELSMEAEHRLREAWRRPEDAPQPEDAPRFFVLHRASDAEPVEVESRASWGDLQKNPIFEAYAAHYDHEQDMFARSPGEEP